MAIIQGFDIEDAVLKKPILQNEGAWRGPWGVFILFGCYLLLGSFSNVLYFESLGREGTPLYIDKEHWRRMWSQLAFLTLCAESDQISGNEA